MDDDANSWDEGWSFDADAKTLPLGLGSKLPKSRIFFSGPKLLVGSPLFERILMLEKNQKTTVTVMDTRGSINLDVFVENHKMRFGE